MALARFRLAGNAVGRGQYAAQHRFLLNGQNLRGSIRNSQNIVAEIETPAQSVGLSGICLTLSRTIFLSSFNNGRGMCHACAADKPTKSTKPTKPPKPTKPRRKAAPTLWLGNATRFRDAGFFQWGLDEATYQCRNCKGEMKYVVKTR